MLITVPSFAKINLDLRVLHKRADGYHEVRTVYQTVSLKDFLAIEYQGSRTTQLEIDSSVHIPDNLVLRAARLVLDRVKATCRIRFVLTKKIPMGAGLGGGSSNAAAVLIALPALLKKKLPYDQLLMMAESLGSDVPFFLHGGTALGVGRGTELYPLPDQPSRNVVIIASGIHVSTPEAYHNLGRSLTSEAASPILREFQKITRGLDRSSLDQLPLTNDFQEVVFAVHPPLAGFVRTLRQAGAESAMMTGSGSAVFGIFPDPNKAAAAVARFAAGTAFASRFVTRRHYAHAWRRSLGSFASSSSFAR